MALGFRFQDFVPEESGEKGFDTLFKLFMQLVTITSGDVGEALQWLNELDKQYGLTDNDYGMGDFIEDLKKKGYIDENPQEPGAFNITAKSEQNIRKSALEEIFGKLKKGNSGNHATPHSGQGDEAGTDMRSYEFGDTLEQIQMTESLRNAQLNHGLSGDFMLTEGDLEVRDTEHKTQTSTVLMIDISHSMILYGEDRITPAKKVAMALAELVKQKYPKDFLDVIVFGNDAWEIKVKDLPYLQVGPYHTNTVAGLELAMDLLRKRKTANKQIFMITDGKPTCLKEPTGYYKNSFGLDRKVVNKTLNLAAAARRLKIPITTFMIAQDPYLREFVEEFTEVNQGKAYYSGLKGLGHLVFEDYKKNRRKSL
ncbi:MULTISPECIES: vWA domain-containing protein [Hymenobacter]|uniref:VWA domain-containing protein n=2 Tax=Hymenobacter TaxID=89966 RepID=A0ABS6X0Z4_9BACT|nr:MULTISPECIES: VWA domain-containing protein [Hymenobacter]MBO3269429.1 VWA domain-containing protein [Hymenobacter defluvii]MBW3129504.1 VWA domain-containing protein [Hymenobacter profundi]QNE39099.1 VWA domain-containing protein [Hymenobacter sp. NBH84]